MSYFHVPTTYHVNSVRTSVCQRPAVTQEDTPP